MPPHDPSPRRRAAVATLCLVQFVDVLRRDGGRGRPAGGARRHRVALAEHQQPAEQRRVARARARALAAWSAAGAVARASGFLVGGV